MESVLLKRWIARATFTVLATIPTATFAVLLTSLDDLRYFEAEVVRERGLPAVPDTNPAIPCRARIETNTDTTP